MNRTMIDELEEIVNPARDVQRLSDQRTGTNFARALARDVAMPGIGKMIANRRAGADLQEVAGLDTAVEYASGATALAQIVTIRDRTLRPTVNVLLHQAIGQLELAVSGIAGRDILAGLTFIGTETMALAQDAVNSALGIESAAEQVSHQILELAVGSRAELLALTQETASAHLHALHPATAAVEALRNATAQVSELMQKSSLMYDSLVLSSSLVMGAFEWSQVTDTRARMRALALQMDPLGQVMDRFALLGPLEDAAARLQRNLDDACQCIAGADLHTLRSLVQTTTAPLAITADEYNQEELAEANDQAGIEALPERATSPDLQIVPEFFIASRFCWGMEHVRSCVSRMARRFDARVTADGDALSELLLTLCSHQPTYAARISVLGRRVLDGMRLFDTALRGIAGRTASGGVEQLTVTDAQEFDEAANALIAVLHEIETSLDAAN